MRWLVTGATGFAGGTIARRLLEEGEEVVAVCRRGATGEPLAHLGAEVVEADLSAPRALFAAAKGVDIAVHAASETNWRSTALALGWVNVAGADNVVRAMRSAGVRRLVHLSCADVTLHRRPRMGWNEDKSLTGAPLGAYARTKLEAEELVIGGARPGFETVALRPGWLWGAGNDPGLAALAAESLEGGVGLVGRGDHLLATTHVGNLAEAVVLAGRVEQASGGVYHVVDSEMVLAQDFLGEIARALGSTTRKLGGVRRLMWRARFSSDPRRLMPDEVARRGLASSLDQQRVVRDLGYAPPIEMAKGMAQLTAYIDNEGGARELAKRVREPATDADVEAQRQLAHEHRTR